MSSYNIIHEIKNGFITIKYGKTLHYGNFLIVSDCNLAEDEKATKETNNLGSAFSRPDDDGTVLGEYVKMCTADYYEDAFVGRVGRYEMLTFWLRYGVPMDHVKELGLL